MDLELYMNVSLLFPNTSDKARNISSSDSPSNHREADKQFWQLEVNFELDKKIISILMRLNSSYEKWYSIIILFHSQSYILLVPSRGDFNSSTENLLTEMFLSCYPVKFPRIETSSEQHFPIKAFGE